MPARVTASEDGYTIAGGAPATLKAEPESVRLMYWGWILEYGLKAKDRDLAAGLDKDGKPLEPIKPATREHRRSAMTPTGKGDPNAPPLEPGRQKSRVRSLLTGKAFADRCEFWWKFDPHTGGSFARILDYQAGEGRDVFGLSPKALKRTVAQATSQYDRYKKGLSVTMPRTIKVPMAGPITVKPPGAGELAGKRTWADWEKAFRKEAPAAIPGRPEAPYNVLLQHIWGEGGPPAAKARAALKPKPKPAPPKPVPTVAGKERDRISQAWRDSLSPAEAVAIRTYANSDYIPINYYLRNPSARRTTSDMAAIEAKTGHLDTALARARLDKTFQVWRGVRDLEAMGLDPDNLIGSVIEDPGFLSTSFEKSRARSFVQERPGGALFRILAPKGSRGAFIAPLPAIALEGEQEVLFARGARLRITGVSRDKDGTLIIDVELSHGR